MRRSLLSFFLVIAVFLTQLFGYNSIEIKSLRVYSTGDETSFPVIDVSTVEQKSITIEFDVSSSSYPTLEIQFRFCDSDWQPYDNAFLQNPLYSYDSNIFLDRLPNNVRGAGYHFKESYPNKNVTFPFSGKWMFFISDSHDRNLVYASGKFYVVIPNTELNINVAKENLLNQSDELAILGRTISLRTKFSLPDSLFPNLVNKVEIIKNKLVSYPIIIDRFSLTRDRFYEWDASRNFTFIARNLRPGNEYRETDTRSVGKYNAATVPARFGEIDLSDLFTRRPHDINGGSLLMNYRNPDADYHNVLFKFRAPDNIHKPIFLVGSFTNWKVLSDYEMYDDSGMMNLTVSLKRGLYDYQYVTGDFNADSIQNIDWEILEGNFFETQNEFYIFLYYKEQEKGGYDKIIGYKKIKTGAL